MRAILSLALLLTTAGHGLAAPSKDRLVYIDDLAGGADRIRVATVGATAGLSIAPGAPRDTLARLLAPHDDVECQVRTDAPRRPPPASNAAAPPIVCRAQAGWSITTHQGDRSAQASRPLVTGH
jgi:hypothetical protein